MAGEWIDQRGVEALAAAVIERAYIDYITARQRAEAWRHRTHNDIAMAYVRKWIGEMMTARRAAQRVAERKGCGSKWSRCTDEELKAFCYQEARENVKMCEDEQRKLAKWFQSGRYKLFGTRIDGESLKPFADSQVRRWLAGEIDERELLPHEPPNKKRKKEHNKKWDI